LTYTESQNLPILHAPFRTFFNYLKPPNALDLLTFPESRNI
jgi:hypothetical protein